MKVRTAVALRPLLLPVLLVYSAIAIMPIAAQTASENGRAPTSRHVLYAPIAGVQEFDEWTLILLNRDVAQQNVAVTIYSSNGQPYAPLTISLRRKETRYLDVRRLLSARATNAPLGGISLEYDGPPLTIAARMMIRGFHGIGNLDVPFQERQEARSNTLAAAWWEPASARTYVILGNSSERAVHADIVFDSGAQTPMDLAPFATAIQPFVYATQGRLAGARISSVHIDYTGLPGMLRVVGFTTSLPEHFFNSIHFVDPKLSTEAALYASGLHLEDAAKHIAVKNISEVPVAVYGTVYPASGAQGGKSLSLPSLSLAPGQSSELDLSGITAAEKVAGAAMKLVSSAGPASIIANFTSIESGHGMARSVPFIDSSDPAALTGGYHWRIDGEYTSVISVTNVGATRSAIAGFIRPNGGKDFKIATRYLEPNETVTFNIKDLRDDQVSDPNGIKLPKVAIAGQFEWSAILGDGSERLIGSADVSNPSLSVSIPDTVYHCNCPLSAISAFIDPGIPYLPIGGEASATSELQYKNVCNGDTENDPFATLAWSVDDPGILSVTANQIPATVRGLAAGSSGFTSTNPYNFRKWQFSPSNGCTSSWVQLKPKATGMVGAYQVQPIATASQFPAACPAGQAGWNRNVTNQVQYANGVGYAHAGLSVSDILTISFPNPLGISGTETGTTTTTGDGSFPDNYSVCSTACPTSSGEADAIQNWTVNAIPLFHTNGVIYKCSSITIDGK